MGTIETGFASTFADAANVTKPSCRSLGTTIEGYVGPPIAWSLNTTVVASLPAAPTGWVARIAGANSVSPSLVMDAFAAVPTLAFRRFNGTGAAQLALASGNQMWAIQGWGRGATAISSAARVVVAGVAAQAWTDTAQGTYVSISTTAIGTVAATERVRVENDGMLTCLGGINVSGKYSAANTRTAPASGATVTLSASVPFHVIDPVVDIAALTVSFPASPTDGQVQRFSLTKTASTLTLSGGVFKPPSPIFTALGGYGYIFITGTWYRVT